MTIFIDFHWPTFFISLAFFILAVNVWNIIKFTLARNRARASVKRSEAKMQSLLVKLKSGKQEINDLLTKIKQPKS